VDNNSGPPCIYHIPENWCNCGVLAIHRAVLGPIATDEGNIGPFSDAIDYFLVVAQIRYDKAKKKSNTEEPNWYHLLGPLLNQSINTLT
jgi:hypothetical protein